MQPVPELARIFANLRRAGHRQYKQELGYLHAFMAASPVVQGILTAAHDPTFDAKAWIEEKVIGAKRTSHEWPPTEPRKMAVLWAIIERIASADENPAGWGRQLGFAQDLSEQAQTVTSEIVQPLLAYVEAAMADTSGVLNVMRRYQRQVAWFDYPTLYEDYLADTKRGEALYDRHLRKFLFAAGIDHPFSQPSSPSGAADVVAGLETADPLVCEVKLYDADRYRVPYLAKGLRQAGRYAHDHGKSTAYLVVFNISEERLQMPSDDSGSPPCLIVEGVRVFLVVVAARPLPSASKDSRSLVRAIERDQLVTLADADD